MDAHLWSAVSRSWLTPWCLCAASCVQCLAQPQRDSARLSRLSPSKFPSLAPPSAMPSWREQPRTLTEPWSKNESWWNSCSQAKNFSWHTVLIVVTSSVVICSCVFREVKLSVVSYLTNSIVDQILQELYTTHKTLVLVISLLLHDFFLEM